MSRSIVNFATGRYVTGQQRLLGAFWSQCGVYLSRGAGPTHQERPYAFKAFALKEAARHNDTLLWCDACILPGARPLTDLWEKIERDGVWLARNGYANSQWTADSAYPDLFTTEDITGCGDDDLDPNEFLTGAREVNREIPHVVATAFGVSLAHPKGRAFLDEYYRLASETTAFCGPWTNTPETPCGPADVRGHRHDQTAASVIAWRLGVELTDCPEWFAYRGGETDKTCLIADGAY